LLFEAQAEVVVAEDVIWLEAEDRMERIHGGCVIVLECPCHTQ
jgi:hypothetical protein